jgi:hypothetical protein
VRTLDGRALARLHLESELSLRALAARTKAAVRLLVDRYLGRALFAFSDLIDAGRGAVRQRERDARTGRSRNGADVELCKGAIDAGLHRLELAHRARRAHLELAGRGQLELDCERAHNVGMLLHELAVALLDRAERGSEALGQRIELLSTRARHTLDRHFHVGARADTAALTDLSARALAAR